MSFFFSPGKLDVSCCEGHWGLWVLCLMLIHFGIMLIVIQVDALLEEDLLSYIEDTPVFFWLRFWDTQRHQHVLKQVSSCKVVASRQISSNLFAIFDVDPTIWYAVIRFSSRYSTIKQYCCCFSYALSLVWLLSSRRKVQRQKKRQGQAFEICKHVWTTLLWAWKAPIVADAADAPVPPVDDAIAAEPPVDDTIAAEVPVAAEAPVADAIAAEVPSTESLAHCPRIGRTCGSQLCFSWRS